MLEGCKSIQVRAAFLCSMHIHALQITSSLRCHTCMYMQVHVHVLQNKFACSRPAIRRAINAVSYRRVDVETRSIHSVGRHWGATGLTRHAVHKIFNRVEPAYLPQSRLDLVLFSRCTTSTGTLGACYQKFMGIFLSPELLAKGAPDSQTMLSNLSHRNAEKRAYEVFFNPKLA